MKIYMAGVGGMLGQAFWNVFNSRHQLKCSDIDINEEWLTYCDFRDYLSYRSEVVEFSPDFLFHIGALTDLEFCEENIFECYSSNTLAVENACLIAKELDIPLLYVSTAGIFDGRQDTYDDYSRPSPLCHYARSKYQGEIIVDSMLSRYFICRAGWMMGGGPQKDKKFVNKIISQINSGATELNIVNDRLGTPTYTLDFARNCQELLNSKFWGTYNMVCGGTTSRLEVVEEILRVLNLSDRISINEVESNFFKEEYFAPRPASERLLNRKLELRGLNIMRDWKVCLYEYLNSDYSQAVKY